MQKLKFIKGTSALLAGAATVLLLTHCGKKDAPTATVTQNYAGAGSDWKWTLNGDGTFSASESTTTTTIGGTFSRISSTGFVLLTVTTSSGASAPVTGSQAYALEVPGVALLVKPILSTESQIISMVAAGVCPTGDYSGNWVLTQFSPGVDTSQHTTGGIDTFGTFAWNQAAGSATLPTKFAVDAYTAFGAGTAGAGTCVNGTMTVGGAKMYLTQNGGAVVKLPAGAGGGGGVLVLPATSISATSAFAGNYAGLLFDNFQTNKIRPLNAVVTAAGAITVTGVSDVTSGAADATLNGSVQIDQINQPSAGFLEATVTTPAGTGKMACSTGVNVVGGGKNIIFCAGQSPGHTSSPFNLLLVSK